MSFLSLAPDKLLALTAYGEAASEGAEGMLAVMNVIKNRTKNISKFGDLKIYDKTKSKYHAVILKPYQFSIYNENNPVRPKLERIAKMFDSYLAFDNTLKKAYELSKKVLSGFLPDNTGGATYYHADYVKPAWRKSVNLITKIGKHIFYSSDTYKTGYLTVAIALGIALGFIYLSEKRT
jgi:hypothetical protein